MIYIIDKVITQLKTLTESKKTMLRLSVFINWRFMFFF